MWFIMVRDWNGFSFYDTVEAGSVAEMDDCWGMTAGNMDLMLPKEHTFVTDSYWYYRGENAEVLVEIL